MGWRTLLPGVVLLVLAQPRTGLAQCNASQLCAPGGAVCVVSAPCTIPAGASFDVRPRDLVLQPGVRLTVGPGTNAVQVRAANVRLEAGARIVLQGDDDTGGTLDVEAAGGITMRTGTVIEATGMDSGGQVTLSADDDVILDGAIDASANANNGSGGTVSVTSHLGRVTLGGNGVLANGGTKGELGGFGGSIALQSFTDLTVDAPIAAAHGDCFFCSIDLFAQGGTLTTTARGTLDVRGSGGIGGGGTVGLTAGKAVVISGAITATAAGSPDAGGEQGGSVAVAAFEGSVLLAGSIDLSGAAPDGDGGTLDVAANLDVRVGAPVSVRTEAQGEGGAVTIEAGRSLFIESSIDARGGSFGGGDVAAASAASLDVLGAAMVLTDGRDGGPGGSSELEGCHVDVRAGALLSNLGVGSGPFAGTILTAHASMAVGGTLRTDVGGKNALVSRATAPTVLPSASITPAPQVVIDAMLACCENCPATTTTSTTSTTSSTTTSTLTPPTTSTTTSTSSTTTTSSATSSSTTSTSSTSVRVTSTSTTSTSTTTAPGPSSTTTTLAPTPCDDEAEGSLPGLTCRLAVLQAVLDGFADDAIGGPKTARSLAQRLARAERQATIAANAKKPLRPLRRVAKELHRFDALVARAERRGTIAGNVAAVLRAASAEVGASLERLEASS